MPCVFWFLMFDVWFLFVCVSFLMFFFFLFCGFFFLFWFSFFVMVVQGFKASRHEHGRKVQGLSRSNGCFFTPKMPKQIVPPRCFVESRSKDRREEDRREDRREGEP